MEEPKEQAPPPQKLQNLLKKHSKLLGVKGVKESSGRRTSVLMQSQKNLTEPDDTPSDVKITQL